MRESGRIPKLVPIRFEKRRRLDVELFDLEEDPLERNNLALDRNKSGALLEQMNAKLNALIDQEVGEDAGQMLPGGVDGAWVASDAVNDV